jgi:hypothetical protein
MCHSVTAQDYHSAAIAESDTRLPR